MLERRLIRAQISVILFNENLDEFILTFEE